MDYCGLSEENYAVNMNEGCGEIGKPPDPPPIQEPTNKRKHEGAQFGVAIARIAIAQVCESVGFQGFQPSAIDTLSDIALRYIYRIGRESHFHSYISGRTRSTFSDLLRGLEDVNSVQGFSGDSDPSHSSLRSCLLSDIALYIHEAQDGPLLRRLPSFPLLGATNSKTLSFPQSGLQPPAAHIPPWLPPFPDSKTYTNSDETSLHSMDMTPLLESHTKAKEEKSSGSLLCQLQHRHSFAISEGYPFFLPSGKLKRCDEGSPISGVEDNTSGEPSFSLVEVFAPVVEAVKRLPDFDEGNVDFGKGVLLVQRRNVRSRIGIGRTMSVNEVNMHARMGGGRKSGQVHVKEVEKDDRMKRAEKILKECMDNPNELVQM